MEIVLLCVGKTDRTFWSDATEEYVKRLKHFIKFSVQFVADPKANKKTQPLEIKKEEAKKIYKKAKNEGKSASLVEQQRPNIFTTSVANIAPGGTITVAIEYLQSVQIDNNTYSIRFPMVVGDRYIPGMPIKTSNNAMGVSLDTHEVDDASKITPPSESIISALTGRKFTTYLPVEIEINLRSGFELESLESSYHKINKIQIDNQTQHILLVEGYEADRDFELTWSPIQTDEPEISNGLENFEIEEETPELFNSGNEENLSEESLESKETDNIDEDDLEIPAFLRRQKN